MSPGFPMTPSSVFKGVHSTVIDFKTFDILRMATTFPTKVKEVRDTSERFSARSSLTHTGSDAVSAVVEQPNKLPLKTRAWQRMSLNFMNSLMFNSLQNFLRFQIQPDAGGGSVLQAVEIQPQSAVAHFDALNRRSLAAQVARGKKVALKIPAKAACPTS